MTNSKTTAPVGREMDIFLGTTIMGWQYQDFDSAGPAARGAMAAHRIGEFGVFRLGDKDGGPDLDTLLNGPEGRFVSTLSFAPTTNRDHLALVLERLTEKQRNQVAHLVIAYCTNYADCNPWDIHHLLTTPPEVVARAVWEVFSKEEVTPDE